LEAVNLSLDTKGDRLKGHGEMVGDSRYALLLRRANIVPFLSRTLRTTQ